MRQELKNTIYSIFFFLLIFLTCLDTFTSNEVFKFFLKHIDESIVLILYIYIFLNITFIVKAKKRLLLLWMIFILIGTMSSMIYQYQNLFSTIIDCLLIINKFFVGYLATYIYILKYHNTISDKIYKIAIIITLFLFLIAVHDLLFSPFFEKADFRYFTYSLKLMFPHATYLAAAGMLLLIYFGYKRGRKGNVIYMLMATFLMVVTFRGKALGFVAVYWILYLCFFRFKLKHFFVTIMSSGFISLVIGAKQIQEYFFTDDYSPRLILLKDSISQAINHFPLGTGFGTFGSSMAAENYSILYTKLGYEQYWGMSSNDYRFLTDDFWPIIIAQFGFFGLLVFIAILYCFFYQSFLIIKQNKRAGFTMLMVLIGMLINSFAETAFFNPTAMSFFIIFGMCEAEAMLERKEINKL